MPLSTNTYGYVIDPLFSFCDQGGKTIANGYVRVFRAGTSTPVLTYRNYDGAFNAETIELDNSGRTMTQVIASKGDLYKVCVYDAEHSQEDPILTVDKVAVIGASVNATNIIQGLNDVAGSGWIKSVSADDTANVSLDPTGVSDHVDTFAQFEAHDQYKVPLVKDDGSQADIKMGALAQNTLLEMANLASVATAADTDKVVILVGGAPKIINVSNFAQKVLAGNIAPAFVPNSTTTVAGRPYIYSGLLYIAKEAFQGPWDASKFERVDLEQVFGKKTLLDETIANLVKETGFRIANEVSSRSYSLLKFYTDSSLATEIITGGYFGPYGNFVAAEGYTNLVFGVKDFSSKIYFASSLAYRQVCVFNGIVDQAHFVARYRSSDSTLPLEANPLTILPGQVFVIGNTSGQSEDFVFYSTWNGKPVFTEDAVTDMTEKMNSAIVAIADNSAGTAESAAKSYAESQASAAEAAAKAYADSVAGAVETAAKSYADSVSGTAESAAKAYAGNLVLSESGARKAEVVAEKGYSAFRFYTDSSKASDIVTGGYYDGSGNFVEAEGYTNLVFNAKDFSSKIYFEAGNAYRQICVFNGVRDAAHFVARYRSSDSTLPLEADPLTILPGQIFVIGNTANQTEDFVFNTTWNGTIEFTDESVNAMLNQAKNGIAKIADKEIDDNVFKIITGVTLDKTSSLVTVMDGYVGGPDGNISANSSYVSYIYDVNVATNLYANATESSYLSVSVTNKEMTSGVRYRLKTSSPSEDTLPYENSPVSVAAGKRLIISTTKTNDKAWSFELPSEQYRESFNPNVPLAEAHVEQVLNQIVDGKILVKYVDAAGTEDSTERVEVNVPTKVGYVQYLFLHNVNVSRNCDVWRVAYAYACAANLEQRFALTRAGEWECAIRLEDRDDFAGGYTHGDEILVGSPIFFVDGKEILLSDIATLTRCKEFRCVTKSSMVDPSDHETIFATHGCEHQFTAKGLRVRQSIEWLGSYNINNTYMAMNLPNKDYTDTYYTDKDVFAQAIPNPLSKHEIGAGYLCMFKDSTKTFNEFYLGKNYPADPWLYLTDNSSTYNKGYFVINMSTPRAISSGTIWKAEFFTRYEVGA